jgi:hypothetical protein
MAYVLVCSYRYWCASGEFLRMSWGPSRGLTSLMAKRSQAGWRVKCEDRLPYYIQKSEIAPAACHLPRLHDHDSTTREDLT